MDLELSLIYYMSQSTGFYERIVSEGVTENEIDDGEYKKAFSFIRNYFDEHDSLPSHEVVGEVNGFSINVPIEDEGFIVKEFFNRRLFRRINKTMGSAERLLKGNDPEQAYEMLKQFTDGYTSGSGSNSTSIFSIGNDVVQYVQDLLDGKRGIPMPWETLDDITMGLWNATMTFFVARPGTGKTMIAILLGYHAWINGYPTLFISPEMSEVEIAERFFLYHSKTSAVKVLQGKLTAHGMQNFTESVRSLNGNDGFEIYDFNKDLSEASLNAVIRRMQPALVIVDSIYMLKFRGSKAERTEKAIEWIRGASKKFNIPFVGIHQLSRDAVKSKNKGGAGYDVAAIALTDQLLWDAQAVYVLEQDKDMRANKRLKINVGKYRRGHWDGKPVELNWDWDAMDFDEISTEEDQFIDGEEDGIL